MHDFNFYVVAVVQVSHKCSVNVISANFRLNVMCYLEIFLVSLVFDFMHQIVMIVCLSTFATCCVNFAVL